MELLQRGKNGTRRINELLTALLPSAGTPVNAVAAVGKLTVDTQVDADDTLTVGDVTYTFKAGATAAAGEIGIGANVAAAKLAIVAAINGTDSQNEANPLVVATAFDTNDCALTARTKGAAGNDIDLGSSFTTETNVLDGAKLGETTAGVDATVGVTGQQLVDASYLYLCLADNSVSGTNWRRISLGSAY